MATNTTAYDIVPYLCQVISETAPNHIALCSLWHGGPAPPTHGFRVIELGCGDGANLLPLAFYQPDSKFIGIDNSAVNIKNAQKKARTLGLDNLIFEQRDIRDLFRKSYQPFDYILVHGLFSWVTDEARRALLCFCREKLTPSGLAYICYNTQPGWALRGAVRSSLLRSDQVIKAPIAQKAARAIKMAETLLAELPSRRHSYGALLGRELERVRNNHPSYILHEYLADINDAFWFRDFAGMAAEYDLAYIADAQFCRYEGQVPPKLFTSIKKKYADPLEREEIIDLLCNRQLRLSILCRKEASGSSYSHKELLDKLYIAAALSVCSDQFQLADGVPEIFSGNDDIKMQVEHSLTKAAVVLLSSKWPLGLKFEELFKQAVSLLEKHGFPIPEKSRQTLAEDIILGFGLGQLELRLHEPARNFHLSNKPATHKLARYEAASRDALTTPHHTLLQLDEDARMMINLLDGSRTIADLQKDFGKQVTQRILDTLLHWGLLNEPGQVNI